MSDIGPEDVLKFWFEECSSSDWFSRSDAFDAGLQARFGVTLEAAAAGELDSWMQTDRGALALLIVLDQFSRNLFRGSPRSFAQDAKALDIARQLVDAGKDRQFGEFEKLFLYMPFEHSEDLPDQERCVELVGNLADKSYLEYAIAHRDVIAEFGRFPHRNGVLGREMTSAEQDYLDGGGRDFSK